MITRKNEQSLECCLSSQTVSNCSNELLTKTCSPCIKRVSSTVPFYILYDWIILSEIFENKPFKFVPNNREKLLNGRG